MQIIPIIDLLAGLQSPSAEKQVLLNAFENSLKRSFGDDRSFVQMFYGDAYKINSFIVSTGGVRRESLTAAWREFLAKNAGQQRCLDNKPRTRGEIPSPLGKFNFMFADDKKFKAEDFELVEYKGTANDKLYLDSQNYKKISLLFKTARETKNSRENKDDKAATNEWYSKILAVLEPLDLWVATDNETEAEVFSQKAMFYDVIVQEVGDQELKATVIRAFLRYLANSPMQRTSFIEWQYNLRRVADKNPEMFKQLLPDFPNPNFRVMVAAKKLGF